MSVIEKVAILLLIGVVVIIMIAVISLYIRDMRNECNKCKKLCINYKKADPSLCEGCRYLYFKYDKKGVSKDEKQRNA